jgi:hypothetical protein
MSKLLSQGSDGKISYAWWRRVSDALTLRV